MSDQPDVPPTPETPGTPLQPPSELSDVVRRTLIQLGDLQNLEARVKAVGERLSKITPPPKPVEGQPPEDVN